MSDDTDDEITSLLDRARRGDAAAREDLFSRHRPRLRRMVELRLDARLRARVDASDVLQEGFVDVVRRLDDYLADPKLPLFVWMRLVVAERLLKVHRHHLGTQGRDAGREVSLDRPASPQASSAALAAGLLGRQTSPTEAVVRAERLLALQVALDRLEPIDREIVTMRHFEELSSAEAVAALGIQESAAAKRYVRAMKRLREAMGPT